MFSPKRSKRGSVNSVFMRFSITIFPGRVSDFRLKGESLPPPALKALGGVTPPTPQCPSSTLIQATIKLGSIAKSS